MKNIFKLLLVTILSFSFLTLGHAIEIQEETQKGIDETKEFCLENIQKGGCLYDPNDTLYTSSGQIYNENWAYSILLRDAKLTRGYQAVDSDGNLVFAGCYKFTISPTDKFLSWASGGDGYAFKIVKLSGGKCKTTNSDIVPSEGIKYRNAQTVGFEFSFDGKNGIGADMAIYDGWTAVTGGNCPLIFGLTENTKWYTKTSNKYAFTDDSTGFLRGKGVAFSNEVYERSTGCTINDKKGYEEASACFNKAIAKIDSYTCPSDLSNLSKMSEELAGYQTECDSELAVLYANKLLNDNAKEFSDKLKAKVEEKVNSCQLSKCNISSSQAQKISEAKAGTKCANGCSITSQTQSSAENAQCYCCGGTSRGCTYTWTEKPGTTCAKVNKTKTNCVGNSETDTCLSCLEDAYNKAGLTSTQKQCMKNTDVQKSQAITEVKEDIDNQFKDQVDAKLEENKKLYESIENYQFEANLPSPGFGDGGESCDKIVGDNIAKLIKLALNVLRIAGAIIAIVNGMMTLIPAVVSKDPDALKKAGNKCMKLGIILLVIGVFPTILRFIAKIFGYDLSCIF